MKLLFRIFPWALICAAHAQDTGRQPASVNASIRGEVKDSVSGRPLANYMVSTSVNATWVNNTILTTAATKDVHSITDESGRYKLSDLPPGDYQVSARDAEHFSSELTKRVTLSGHDFENLDFHVPINGTISGKVFDENKEPIPDMTVLLVSKEYFLGAVGYFLKSSGRTNDRGEYKLARVEAGHPYTILAEKRVFKIPARSETPLNPKLRRRIPVRTWYLNSPVKEGAVVVTVRPGENREGVDIEMKKSPSYCIDGILSTPNGPSALSFSIEAQQPSSGISHGGGMFMAPPSGVTGLDGKFRICDLYPASYRLLAMQTSPTPNAPPAYYSATTISIADRDITGLRIIASGGMDVDGEVVLEGPQPPQPILAKIGLFPSARLRANYGDRAGGRYGIPGNFSWKGMMVDDYTIRGLVNSPGLYVKDILYNDRSVLYEPWQLGSAMGNAGLKVIVGQDGGTVGVRVADKDGNPAPDTHVVLMPAEVASEGVLAARLISGQTDQTGQYTSPTMPPGKYFAAASTQSFNMTQESIDQLWKSRNHFTEVVLPPGGKVQVNLEPIP